MAEDLRDEINAAVLARFRVRDIPKAIWDAAVEEVSEETPPHPAFVPWLTAQMHKSSEAKGYIDEREIAELAAEDELLGRRMGDVWEKIRRRVVEKLIAEEFVRRVAEGTVVEVPMPDGETGYVRKEEP
jgi:hypothetical protein